MSRLDEECIMYVGRNRSGMDAGEIDYGIFTDKFDCMSVGCLEDALKSLDVLRARCSERIIELKSDTRNKRRREEIP